MLSSLAKANRLLVVEEGPLTDGWAGEVVALVAEHGLHDIDDIWRLTTPDHPIPYSHRSRTRSYRARMRSPRR